MTVELSAIQAKLQTNEKKNKSTKKIQSPQVLGTATVGATTISVIVSPPWCYFIVIVSKIISIAMKMKKMSEVRVRL